VEINSLGLVLSTTQARYQKGLRKTAINLSKDFEYEAELPLDVLLFLSTLLSDVQRCNK